MIRATLDANVLISHLLKPMAEGPPSPVIKAAVDQSFELTIVDPTLDEMARAIREKPYLSSKIDAAAVMTLERSLRLVGRVIPESIDRIPSLTRDPADDYLLAHAVLEELDYLVSGDRDLLVLGEFEGVRIVSPAAFLAILDHPD